jgi:hypothetical protein
VYLEDGPALQSSSRVRLSSPKLFERIFMSPHTGAESVIAPLEPFAMNERLALQQGMFLCPTTFVPAFRVDPDMHASAEPPHSVRASRDCALNKPLRQSVSRLYGVSTK